MTFRVVTLALSSASLISVAHRPWGHGLIACVALIPLMIALTQETRLWRAALVGWIASLGAGLVAFEGVAPAEPWAYPILATVAGLWPALAAVAFVATSKRFGPTTALCSFPAFVVAAEFLPAQRALFGGFANGMNGLGYSQFDTPLLAAAGWSGVSGVSLLVVAANAALLLLVRYRRTMPAVAIAVLATAAVAVPVPGGNRIAADRDPLRIAVVQGAVSSVDTLMARFDREAAQRMVAPYADLTARAAELDVDLVLWGETVLPHAVRPGHVPDYVARALEPAPVALIGGVSFVDERSFNSIFEWRDGDLTEVYRKRALVPFNESHYTPGSAMPPLGVNGVPVGLGICLDSVHGSLARQSVRSGAEILVYLTEDSFAGRTVTPELHLRVTAFRGVETGRHVVFANQSGPSAIIDHRGNVVERLPHGEAAGATAVVRAYRGITPFVRFGDWVGLFAVSATLVLVAMALWRRGDEKDASWAGTAGDRCGRGAAGPSYTPREVR